MPYSRLGDSVDCSDPLTAVSNASCYGGSSSSGIDWTQVITTGEQVVGQAIKPGTVFPTTYPTYLPTSSAFAGSSNLLPLLLFGGVAVFALRGR